jgi:uroporphyrinogen decarboxylase
MQTSPPRRTPLQGRFLDACLGRPVDRVPVWFMRQAGRSLPEYRTVKARHSLLEICRNSDLAAEVTMQPVTRLGVDAAILFSDIVVPLLGMGVKVDIEAGVGPVFATPLRTGRDVDRLTPLVPQRDLPYVLRTVELVAAEVGVPLIGFAGGPFTLACYLIEGRPSKDHSAAKAFMHSDPGAWRELMNRLTDAVTAHLGAQIKAGASAVQLFDSWVGWLDGADFRVHVLPWVTRIFSKLRESGVPAIYFGVATGELLELMAEAGPDVIGVDWRVPLDRARARLPEGVAVQGNLDPAACLAPREVMEAKAADVLVRGGGRGHVFNLGHGVLPATDPAALARLVDVVHEWELDA